MRQKDEHTNKALHVAGEFHSIVQNDRDDASVDKNQENEYEELPPPPTMSPCERKLREEVRTRLVVFGEGASSPFEFAPGGSTTIVVRIRSRSVFESIRTSSFQLARFFLTLSAIFTPSAVCLIERRPFVVFIDARAWVAVRAKMDIATGDLVGIARVTAGDVHAGTRPTDNLGHRENSYRSRRAK